VANLKHLGKTAKKGNYIQNKNKNWIKYGECFLPICSEYMSSRTGKVKYKVVLN
jgi:hypothetical protein